MSEYVILSIEAVPGDTPRSLEQPNGDLLLPASARPLVAQALLQARSALAAGQPVDLPALEAAMDLLGIERSEPESPWLANFYRITPI
jgi:hypothetical protein